VAKISDDDLRRIVSLFEMVQRASQEDADEHVRNEGTNATGVLLRLLGKYGLNLADIPDIARRHEQATAAKAATKTATPAQEHPKAPNALELTHHVLREYVDMAPHEYIGTTLWFHHAHVFDHFPISPRLALLSPVRNCGKSLLLHLAERLTPNAERHDSISAATIFRLIDHGARTLLLDEGDNLGLKIERNLRSVLNSGYQKGGYIGRTIRGEPTKFSTYAPAAIAAIGMLPLPLMRRSVVIRMHRTSRTDLKTYQAMAASGEVRRLEALRRHMIAWSQTAQFNFNPRLPKILRGGTADIWRVLISIADSFQSTYWSKAARDAVVAFANGFYDEDAPVALLFDIRTILRRLGVDRIKGALLTQELHELEDGAGVWTAWRGENDDAMPHAITPGEIAALLRRFDLNLRPKPLFELGSRESRGKAARGFYKHQFEPWWQRYCPEKDDENADSDNVRQLHTKSE
jgi:putative DNA primase/helicase